MDQSFLLACESRQSDEAHAFHCSRKTVIRDQLSEISKNPRKPEAQELISDL
jgi:hypothetical protein